jgi:hypothetical protein
MGKYNGLYVKAGGTHINHYRVVLILFYSGLTPLP